MDLSHERVLHVASVFKVVLPEAPGEKALQRRVLTPKNETFLGGQEGCGVTGATKITCDSIEVKYGSWFGDWRIKVPCVFVGRYLAVHRALCATPILSKVKPALEKRRWTITHIPSGHSVNMKCSTRKQAMKVARELDKRWLWNFRTKKSRLWKSQLPKVGEYLVEIGLMS